MNRNDLHVGQKVNVHRPRGDVLPGTVEKIGRTLVTIKTTDFTWSTGDQYYIAGGNMKGDYSQGYFFRTDEQEAEHVAYEKAMDVLKRHKFDAYRVDNKAKVIAVASLLLNEYGSQ
jgi:hypothetical protein